MQNYDRLYPYTKKGRKAVYEEAAQKVGMSLNEFMVSAMEEKAQRVFEAESQQVGKT